jgi:hypothetical protein
MRWSIVFVLAGCHESGSRPPDGGSGGIDGGLVDAGESGRLCTTGAMATDPTVLASPALECPSRVCLHAQGSDADMCTARCTTAADCVNASASACTSGFVCQVVVNVGPFACQPFCVCASTPIQPPACDV